jgi:hypothetical protein
MKRTVVAIAGLAGALAIEAGGRILWALISWHRRDRRGTGGEA